MPRHSPLPVRGVLLASLLAVAVGTGPWAAGAADPPFDGEAALRHASALAALGPHPWGSPRSRAAAAYVAAQLEAAGVKGVQLQEFERAGIRGVNAVGTLPGPGTSFLLVSAHHDTAPEAPGAYDDGGGVGILIEAARLLARRPSRPLPIVFASFDGEEAWWTRKTTVAGAREYMQSLGTRARDVRAAFDIEMSGWKGGSPVLHAIAYPDPLRPGHSVIAPGWLVSAALGGARRAGAPLQVGDPVLSWVYQPTVRVFRIASYGDDLGILQAGRPAVFASDSSFYAFYPWYHRPTDTADKLDAASLARMGSAVVGALDGVAAAPAGPARDPVWFAVFGRVLGPVPLGVLGVAALVPGLVRAARAPVGPRLLRLLQAVLLVLLAWRHPVPTLWVFALPLAVTASTRRRLALGLALVPFLLMMTLGGGAWFRGMSRALWLAPWEVAAAVAALGLLFVPMVPPEGGARRVAKAAGRLRGLRGKT
jgi:hypothetical protein